MLTTTPSLEEYWTAIASTLPAFSPEEQRAAVALYGELARGAAVTAEQLGRRLDLTPIDTQALLDRPPMRSLTYRDAQHRLVGFGGLAVVPMHHALRVAGRNLWTWCAWDSLFIPGILGLRAEVESSDPETRKSVRLVVRPDRVERVDPEGAVVSFVMPEAGACDQSATRTMASFCHFVFFFESRDTAERWLVRHPGTFVYPLTDAFELARRLNRTRFGAALGAALDPLLRYGA